MCRTGLQPQPGAVSTVSAGGWGSSNAVVGEHPVWVTEAKHGTAKHGAPNSPDLMFLLVCHRGAVVATAPQTVMTHPCQPST